jgi:hypothetical protein
MRRLAPEKQGFLTKRDEALTAKATVKATPREAGAGMVERMFCSSRRIFAVRLPPDKAFIQNLYAAFERFFGQTRKKTRKGLVPFAYC